MVTAVGDDEGMTLTLSTGTVGSTARLEVTGGDAAPLLGLELGLPIYGTDARVRLGSQKAYTFEDAWYVAGNYYKTRLRNSSSSVVSEFSVPLAGSATRAVTPDYLVEGYVKLVDFQGRPVQSRSVMISTKDTIHNAYINGFVVDMDDQVVTTNSEATPLCL